MIFWKKTTANECSTEWYQKDDTQKDDTQKNETKRMMILKRSY